MPSDGSVAIADAWTLLRLVAACAVPLLDAELPLAWGCACHGEITGEGGCPVERLAEQACARLAPGPWRARWSGALALTAPDGGAWLIVDGVLDRFAAELHAVPIGAPVTARMVCRALLAAAGLFAP